MPPSAKRSTILRLRPRAGGRGWHDQRSPGGGSPGGRLQPLSFNSGGQGGGGQGQGKKKKKKGANPFGRADPFDSKYEDPMEGAKRQKRAGRFEASGASLASRLDERWQQAPRQLMGDDGDIVLDYTVQGTCQEVPKKYLRLTQNPDPRTVRPEPVLKQAIDMVREKYESYDGERTQDQYIWLWEQMKSIRQDLTLQRIRNDFAVQVYEMHARICLEFDDMVEFNQCAEQLNVLYEEGVGTQDGQREFTSYRLLYNISLQASNNISDIMLTLSAEDGQDRFIAHALKVRAASAIGDYRAFFKLYREAPGHQPHVMDTCADRERLAGLRVILRAYQPAVPVSFVAEQLALDEREQEEEDLSFFLTDHGAVLSEDKTLLDCKASRGLLVEHSLAQRREEEEKREQRKRESIPITFS